MASLTKTYHHYENQNCVARYPIKHDQDGVWLLGPIRAVKDKDGNLAFEDRTVTRNGQRMTESVQKWDETHKDEVCAGPFGSETEAIIAIKRKLAPKRPKIAQQQGMDAFAKWKARHERGMSLSEQDEGGAA